MEGFEHPHDTPLSSALRFAVELIAWVAGTWAVAQWSVWLAVPALIVLVGLPSVFSTPGDKKQVVVPTPGPVRVLLELALYVVAVAGAWAVWPTWLAVIATVIVIASLIVGMPRTMWLLRGAPEPGETGTTESPGHGRVASRLEAACDGRISGTYRLESPRVAARRRERPAGRR